MKSKNTIQIFLFIALVFCTTSSCKKLDPEVYDRINSLGGDPDQIAAAVASVYAGLRDFAPLGGAFGNGAFVLNENTSDEVVVPIRGGDWADNFVWEKLWKHKWGADLDFIDFGWKFIYGGIARVNSTLEIIDNVAIKPTDYDQLVAELKTIRAFYYYQAIDWFGGVPIAEPGVVDLSRLPYKKRNEVFDYIEKDLRNNIPFLIEELNPLTYGVATKWFAQALLAKLYLNAQVYTGKPRWADCIVSCDAILNSDNYILEPNFFTNFIIANEVSGENIFVIPFDVNNNLGYFWLQAGTLHYESGLTFGLANGGANGFCSPAAIYNLFDSADTRRKMFLVGQQYVDQIMDSAHFQLDHGVNLPLSFNPEINTFSSTDPAFRMAGARCAKWEFNKDSPGPMSNDFAVYRLADIILMKAEAQYRNGDINGALNTINKKINGISIRSRANLPDFKLSDLNPDGILAERGRELSWEGWRRNDMIRLGHFTDARKPEKAVSEDFRKLYPIPKSEMDKNPYLKQNPGY